MYALYVRDWKLVESFFGEFARETRRCGSLNPAQTWRIKGGRRRKQRVETFCALVQSWGGGGCLRNSEGGVGCSLELSSIGLERNRERH